MNIRKPRSWQAMLVCMGLSWAGLTQANTVAASADPLPTQTLTITTTAATSTNASQVHPRGTVVRLQAAPSPGYQFMGWGSSCSGTTPTCAVTLNGDRTVIARFFPVMTVAVTGPGQVVATSGGISCGADCTEPYSYGFNVALSARPDAGQVFVGWGGACSGTAPTCTVNMSGPRNVTATFAPAQPVQYTLGVAVTGSGTVSSTPAGISCGADCSEAYASGTSVTLTATPAAGQVFSGWGGACSGTASTCTVSMTAARSVTAAFAAAPVTQYTLGVAVTGSGTVSSTPAGISCGADCSEAYASGTSVTLTATPAAGQVFSGWGGACSGTASTCTVGMTAARSVTAAFAAAPVSQFTLSVAVTGNGAVSSAPAGIQCGADCSEAYPSGTSVTLTATPAAGQTFTGWSGACAGTASTCTVSMSQARSVSASFSAVVSSGPVYYFSDCQVGAVAGCVPGNNANPGTSPAAPKQNMSGMNVNTLPAGTQLLFATGGAWTEFGMIISNPNVTATQPLVFSSYATPWGGNTKPWLKVNTGLRMMFVFGWYQEAQNDGGYTLRGLKLDGQDLFPDAGVFIANNVHDVLLEDMEITGFGIGVQAQQNGPHPVTYTLRNSYIHRNSRMGLLGDGTDVVIENNLFEANNFSGSGFNHAIYLGGHGRNGTVRNNRFMRNSVVNGVCTGGNVTVHGQWDGLVIDNNIIEQDNSADGCYGFSINGGYDTAEWFRNVVVRNNRVINLGGCSICLTSAPGVVVENNLIVSNRTGFHYAIVIPDRPRGAGDDADGNAVIRNNTVVFHQAGSEGVAIVLRPEAGTGHRVVSNLVYASAAASSFGRCYSHEARSAFQEWDNNLCHRAAGTGQYSQMYATLGAANAGGFDLHGLSVNPLFIALPTAANGWADQLQATSPARGAAHLTLSATTDRLGAPRPVPATIGAREAGVTPPTAVRAAAGVPRR
ncbi:MAG: right-handed parallel beta-helix repeat-containing protein [Burkholderiales bacterium]|nr:right-handed parallel beta-helix repeat-containing protein [Burkholderiales bacterium]